MDIRIVTDVQGPHTFRIGPAHLNYTYTKLASGPVWKCVRSAEGYDVRPGDVLFLFCVLDVVAAYHGNAEMTTFQELEYALNHDRLERVFRSSDLSALGEGDHDWQSFWNGEWGGDTMTFETTVLRAAGQQ